MKKVNLDIETSKQNIDKRLRRPSLDLNLLRYTSPSKYASHIDEMFSDMGGEYDRFRLENHLQRKPLFELLKERRATI